MVPKGVTYRKLRPEVKQTLEKVVYQLELVSKTLQLMEARVMDSEDKLQTIMTYIKHNDLSFQPKTVNQTMSLNRFDEVTGKQLDGDSPKKTFGEPVPGDHSLTKMVEANQLRELETQFRKTELGSQFNTGKFETDQQLPDNVFATQKFDS